MTDQKEIKCNNCRFCVEIKDPKNIGAVQLVCKSQSPTTVVLPNSQGSMTVIGMWPPVAADEWCGEWSDTPEELSVSEFTRQ